MSQSLTPKPGLDRISFSIGFTECHFLHKRVLSRDACKTYVSNCNKLGYRLDLNIRHYILFNYPDLLNQ